MGIGEMCKGKYKHYICTQMATEHHYADDATAPPSILFSPKPHLIESCGFFFF